MKQLRFFSWVVLSLFVVTAYGLYYSKTPTYYTNTTKPIPRFIIFKLPINQARKDWVFRDKKAFLSGKLTFNITTANKTKTFVIFSDGKIHADWESIIHHNRAEGIYFSFISKKKIDTSPKSTLKLTLILPTDVDGWDPFISGILPKGTYKAKGYFNVITDKLYRGNHSGDNAALKRVANFKAYATAWEPQWNLIKINNTGGWKL